MTYRGVQIGKVTDVKLTENGAEATLTLDTSPKIPADLQAEVRSVSAVGEQYVDLAPTHRLRSVPERRLGHRQGQHHDPASRSVRCSIKSASWSDSIPEDRISDLLDESFKAFNGAGPDFQSLARLRIQADGRRQRRLRPDAEA